MSDEPLYVMRRRLPNGYEYLTHESLGGRTCDPRLASLYRAEDLPPAADFEPVGHMQLKAEQE